MSPDFACSTLPTVVVGATRPLDASILSPLSGIEGLACQGTTATFRTTDVNRTVASLVRVLDEQRIDITELHVQKASLEDVFVRLTTRDAAGEAAAASPQPPEPEVVS